MQVRMSPARIETILTSVKIVREGWSLIVKQFLLVRADILSRQGLKPGEWMLHPEG